ncbi:MAG: hypothetical protein D6709_06075 [Chloroflexi bacterium]|jgi:hypothetical protein|uniref:Uncharacterized protein n=1 Tax=Candidatus Thermofonsia Clade 3 bacterium TaxID=2364212 RepID=A0A2M8QAN5_9CHLR|nr:hypothetical protein [Candidatus Roseilinea sp. NK_OTU-006]PJF46868.1 MAG: hypothetical protein CUN48_11625 [Candidatus Thermofonsia Clade 3 bacterium]RMG64257.1 MAG: hypothetical protein D6709_06075 [Chloroflexota bacterium]
MIDAVAFLIKGALIGGLGGLILPTVWVSLFFGLRRFLQQFTDGSDILQILASLIVIPFGAFFTGLLEGGLIVTTLFGAASGVGVALLVLALRRFISRLAIAGIAGALAAMAAVFLTSTRSSEVTLATGLAGPSLWSLLAAYVAVVIWLSWRLQINTAA